MEAESSVLRIETSDVIVMCMFGYTGHCTC